jgi:hypothetical protein
MSQFDQQWQRLITLARQAPSGHEPAIPAGFATRVAARASASGPTGTSWSMLERLAWRGFVAAAVCGVAAVAFNFSGLMPDDSDDVPVETLAFNPVVDVS